MRLSENLDFIDDLIAALKNGVALRSSLHALTKERQGPLYNKVYEWLQCKESGKSTDFIHKNLHYPENISLFLLLEYGLEGQPVLQSLQRLKEESHAQQSFRLEHQAQILPYKMLFPVFVFFFPALMWSFLAPFLREFSKGFIE